MARTSVVIIGAGQAGLAMSRSLSDLDIEHVVLERGSIAQRWRSHGWDSLRLLTPNWVTRVPGVPDHGYATARLRLRPRRLHVGAGTRLLVSAIRGAVGRADRQRRGRAARRALGERFSRAV